MDKKVCRFISFLLVVSMAVASLPGCAKSSSKTYESEIVASDGISEQTIPVNDIAEAVVPERTAESIETVGNATRDNTDAVTTETLTEGAFDNQSAIEEKTTNGTRPNAVDDGMTVTQRNSLNMLNYLTVLTQEISDSNSSRLYVESAYSSLLNNTYPNAVDSRTQAQLMNILDTLEGYRMVDVKRERLEYIYEQNRAQAMRQAIPTPMSVLNVVESGNWLKAAVSVAFMAVDSYNSYDSYTTQTDLQFLQDGWELDDEEAAELHNSRKQAFSYMLSIVRDNNLQGDYALNEVAVEEFVTWKNNTNVVRRISWLESNQEIYKKFGTYWLTLAESYYEQNEYDKCLNAIEEYEKVTSRIFRKDYDYARVLPMAIVAAREVYDKEIYLKMAIEYSDKILNNIDNSEWMLSFFVAEVYLDIYYQTNDSTFARKACDIAYDNVNYLVDEQKMLNAAYLADLKEAEVPKGSSKREKEEIKQYNEALKAERKTALPPISGALYLNCDLLFFLADELQISDKEKEKVDCVLHENGESIFLMEVLDKRFWFERRSTISLQEIEAFFDGDKFTIPATYLSENASVKVIVNGTDTTSIIDDWKVKEVTRKKKAEYTDYLATLTSEMANDFKWVEGMNISIEVTPAAECPDEMLIFYFSVVNTKKAMVFNGISFERINQ